MRLFAEYIQEALRRAVYDMLSDGTFYGSIPAFSVLGLTRLPLKRAAKN
ncbi:MAG: hypothetical protein ABI068_05080 [Ktedonobacterales bacterium]